MKIYNVVVDVMPKSCSECGLYETHRDENGKPTVCLCLATVDENGYANGVMPYLDKFRRSDCPLTQIPSVNVPSVCGLEPTNAVAETTTTNTQEDGYIEYPKNSGRYA